jgi:dTDP-N-acetylfucosamine:lipid II N-acetylfucosaminyltransferase
MKYVHTIINNPITNPYIDLINRNFNPDDHSFFIIRGFSEKDSKIRDGKNVFIISNLKNIHNGFRLLWRIKNSERIFIHGLFTPYLVYILFLQPWILKKCSWVIWGGDLYDYVEKRTTLRSKIIEYLRANVIRNMGQIITPIKGDYDLARKWYKAKGSRETASYPFSISTEEIDEILERDHENKLTKQMPVNIFIGNSATHTNNHFEIIDYLKQYNNQNVKIYALLAYGDSEYASKVHERGKQIFGDKFESINTFLPFKEFILIYNRIDILIFNHERQQGVGNLFLAMYLKKKVYINNKSPLWDFFNVDLGLTVYTTSDIEKESFADFSEKDNLILMKNKQIIKAVLNEDYIINGWKKLFN